MGEIKFEKEILRADDLQEQIVRVEGEEEHLLRRSVGMPAFETEEKRAEYVADRGEIEAEKEDFKNRLSEGLQAVFARNKGEEYLRTLRWNHLQKRQQVWPGISLDNVRDFEVSSDRQQATLILRHRKYGEMTFKFGAEESKK